MDKNEVLFKVNLNKYVQVTLLSGTWYFILVASH
jgi:hypothetical protein